MRISKPWRLKQTSCSRSHFCTSPPPVSSDGKGSLGSNSASQAWPAQTRFFAGLACSPEFFAGLACSDKVFRRPGLLAQAFSQAWPAHPRFFRRPGLLTRGVLLLYDNARIHTAHTSTALAGSGGGSVFPTHPTAPMWSPRISTSLENWKEHLQGQRFPSENTVKADVQTRLRVQNVF
jgi:hypothetical protein